MLTPSKHVSFALSSFALCLVVPISLQSRQPAAQASPEIRQNYTLRFTATQSGASLDIPTTSAKSMQLVLVSAQATNAATGAVLNDISTVVESNGFVVRPVDGGKPDVDIVSRATLRVISARTKPSSVPVNVLITIAIRERP